jgi:hypothetical protein
MTFYGIDYLKNQRSLNTFIGFVVIGVLCLALVVFTVLYLRHRMQTKYRDLGIIALLLVVVAFGSGYTRYEKSETNSAKATQMVEFVAQVAKDEDVKQSQVFVNSKYLNQDVIVKVDKMYYTVELNTDYTAYRLTPTYMLTDVTIEK